MCLVIFSGWRTQWILCWLSGFCCLPLKEVRFLSRKAVKPLVDYLITCSLFPRAAGAGLEQPSHARAGIFRGDPSEVPLNAQVTSEDSPFLSSVFRHLPAPCKCWELSGLQLPSNCLPDFVEFHARKAKPHTIKDPNSLLCRFLELFFSVPEICAVTSSHFSFPKLPSLHFQLSMTVSSLALLPLAPPPFSYLLSRTCL